MTIWQGIKPIYIATAGFILRLGVGITNSYVVALPGTQFDVSAYHKRAISVAEGSHPFDFEFGWMFPNVVGLLYRVFGQHLIIGSALSAAMWLAGAICMILLLDVYGLRRSSKVFAIALASFWPMSVFYTGLPLKEGGQFMACSALALAAALITRRDYVPGTILFFVASTVAVALHSVLLIWCFAVATLLFATWAWQNRSSKIGIGLAASVLLIVGLVLTWLFFRYFEQWPAEGQNFTALNFISGYRDWLARYSARTDYSGMLPEGGIAIVITPILQYFVEPLPWRMHTAVDIIIGLENIIRLALIVFGTMAIFTSSRRSNVAVLMVSFLLIEMVWALVTTNWGTAARHHIPALGLLIVAASFYLNQRVVAVEQYRIRQVQS